MKNVKNERWRTTIDTTIDMGKISKFIIQPYVPNGAFLPHKSGRSLNFIFTAYILNRNAPLSYIVIQYETLQ